MSAPVGRQPVTPTEPSPVSGETRVRSPEGADPPEPATLATICPFLSTEGGWRSPTPLREHRCQAVEPPAALASDKQRRLCLKSAHLGCATFLAAVEARRERQPHQVPHRPIARTAPLVIERARPAFAAPSLGDGRRWGQVALVGLMVVAFGAVIVARSGGEPETASRPTPAPSIAPVGETPVASPSPAPSASAEPTVAPSPSPAEPSRSPVAQTPSPTSSLVATRTYRVKSGDTLIGIAAQFDTTAAILQELNDIENPRLIRVGQVLQIP